MGLSVVSVSGIKEVQIIQWFVEPGARVEQFDKICEVQSDKATTEVNSKAMQIGWAGSAKQTEQARRSRPDSMGSSKRCIMKRRMSHRWAR